MKSTLKIDDRKIRFQRRLQRNQVFSEILGYFAKVAKETGIKKGDLAIRLGKDPAQISRWFAEPANLTLDTISDLMLALNARLDVTIVPSYSSGWPADDYMQEFSDWASEQDGISCSEIDDQNIVFLPILMQAGTSSMNDKQLQR